MKEYHMARLIVTTIFIILTVSALITRYWYSAAFWAFMTFLIGFPLLALSA